MSAIPFPYVASPRTTDPDAIIREKDIVIRWQGGEIRRIQAELADREAFISELTQELASIPAVEQGLRRDGSFEPSHTHSSDAPHGEHIDQLPSLLAQRVRLSQ